MQIVKLCGHPTVDLLFSRAFPELVFYDLDAGESTPNREDWRYKEVDPNLFRIRSHVEDNLLSACAIGWCLMREAGLFNPDLFIVDDFFSLMVAREVRAKRIVWYCHADYTSTGNPHNEFQRHALGAMGDASTIYPTEAKRAVNLGWREPHRSAVIPLGLPDEAFVQPSSNRNGRACIVRQEIANRLKLYEPEKFTKLFSDVASRMGDTLDVYGDNGEELDEIADVNRCGWVSPISGLRDYSVALEPFGNQSVSVAQLELMAAGIPVVTYLREGFQGTSGPSYLVAEDADQFVKMAQFAMKVPLTIGLNGQEFVRHNYGQKQWAKSVRKFIEGELGAA